MAAVACFTLSAGWYGEAGTRPQIGLRLFDNMGYALKVVTALVTFTVAGACLRGVKGYVTRTCHSVRGSGHCIGESDAVRGTL